MSLEEGFEEEYTTAEKNAILSGEGKLPAKDWGTAELTEEDLSPASVDAILKSTYVYDEEPVDSIPDRGDYRELFSLSTVDRKFFKIFHENGSVYDASILPHPSQHNVWIVVAQQQIPNSGHVVCQSGFLNGVLICGEEEVDLPLQHSEIKGLCKSDAHGHRDDTRPVDARTFFGPDVPYVTYGAPSRHTCYGQHLQDGRRLLRAFAVEQFAGQQTFKAPAEIQKPGVYKDVEKDYFLFWDSDGKPYVHYEMFPQRVFSELNIDGSVGPSIASIAASKDAICMGQYLPRIEDPENQWLQQATNSLSITLCKRKDPLCKPSDSNTHIMHIFHHASLYDEHLVYEPYLALFEQTAPFALTAISQRPFWIHGRDVLSANSSTIQYWGKENLIPEGHTERFSVSGLSWKTHGQKYHGYMDDPVILGLGIEDAQAAGMDVLAGDLVEDLAFCSQ